MPSSSSSSSRWSVLSFSLWSRCVCWFRQRGLLMVSPKTRERTSLSGSIFLSLSLSYFLLEGLSFTSNLSHTYFATGDLKHSLCLLEERETKEFFLIFNKFHSYITTAFTLDDTKFLKSFSLIIFFHNFYKFFIWNYHLKNNKIWATILSL